jgi:hypothetical protein
MTNKQGKKDTTCVDELSETAKACLIEIYVKELYGRQKDISNKYIRKGLMVEEDSITLYSRLKRNFFKKNEDRLTNDFITGHPDLYTGNNILNANSVIDIKSSWDVFTFFCNKTKPLNKDYYWQLQGYMALTGAKTSKLTYCLIDTPDVFINDEKRKLFYKMNATTEQSPDFVEACEAIEKNMTFNDIPLEERVIEFDVSRNDEDIQKMYQRVNICRQFLVKFTENIIKEVA